MTLSKAIVWLNSNLSGSVKERLRKILPTKLKRTLGKRVMANHMGDGDLTKSLDGRLFITIQDRVFLRVLLDGLYEPALTAIGEKLIEKGDKVIDVGANFGWYSTLFAKIVGNSGVVFSYEPLPHSFEILKKNVVNNEFQEIVSTRQKAVGDISGKVRIGVGDTDESGLAHVLSESERNGVDIESITLSKEHSGERGEISFVKIDIEGYEMNALIGARELFEVANQPIIQIELNEEALNRAGSKREEVIQFLKSLNYQFYEPAPRCTGRLREADLDECSDVFCVGGGVYADRAFEIVL